MFILIRCHIWEIWDTIYSISNYRAWIKLVQIRSVLTFNYVIEITSSWPRKAEYAHLTKIPEFVEEFQFQTEDEVTKEEFLSLLADICICLEEECDFLEYLEVRKCNIKSVQTLRNADSTSKLEALRNV